MGRIPRSIDFVNFNHKPKHSYTKKPKFPVPKFVESLKSQNLLIFYKSSSEVSCFCLKSSSGSSTHF